MCREDQQQSKAPEASSSTLKQGMIAFALLSIGLHIATLAIVAGDDGKSTVTNVVAAAEPKTIVETINNTVVEIAFPTIKPPAGDNKCAGMKPDLPNKGCFEEGVKEQSGVNVTKGYNGDLNTSAVPITTPYFEAGLCPVNVHWHLGSEHYSLGQYDESGSGPTKIAERRKLAGETRMGYQCTLFDAKDEKFTKKYDWKHCIDMEVGQTYEVHWPHSAMGACATINQYQTPFYDGVFCNIDLLDLPNVHTQVGVQAQVFTIVNDEDYYYPDLMHGMIVDGDKGMDMAYYTGSTTGTSRSNTICSSYTPITWQVDRKCHMVSASTFDKMCADMKAQRDDMSDDLYAHGSRELVADQFAANNHANLRA